MRSAQDLMRMGDPSTPTSTAADSLARQQPNSNPLGNETGVPPRTILTQIQVTPILSGAGLLQTPTMIVSPTRENRFVTLLAPLVAFSIYVNGEPNLNVLSSLRLPVAIPYEISLPGNQALYAVNDSPGFLALQIQIAAAMSGDIERRL